MDVMLQEVRPTHQPVAPSSSRLPFLPVALESTLRTFTKRFRCSCLPTHHLSTGVYVQRDTISRLLTYALLARSRAV